MNIRLSLLRFAAGLLGVSSPFGSPSEGQGSSPLQVGMGHQGYMDTWNPFSGYGNPLALFYDYYENNTWVKGVCNKIAQEVRNDGWELDDLRDKKRLHPMYNHVDGWLNAISFNSIRYEATLDLAICYNAYYYKQRNGLGQLCNLIRIPPQTMKPRGDAEKGVVGWRQQVGSRYIDFKKEEIWHIKGPNPNSDVVGLPLLTACLTDVEADNAMSNFNRTYFGNGTTAGMVLTWDQENLRNPKTGEWSNSDETKAMNLWVSMVNYIEKRYANPKAAHLPLVLRGDWKVHGQGQAKADAQFLEGRMFNARMVCTVYGFPMEALGLGEKGKLGGTLVDGSQEQLDSVVEGFARMIDESFQKDILIGELGVHDLIVKAKLRPIKITVEATLAAKHLAATGCFTRNEIRAILKHPRLTSGGDEVIQTTPSEVIPQNVQWSAEQRDILAKLAVEHPNLFGQFLPLAA